MIKKYKGVKILGHKEVYPRTPCPGNTFLDRGGWIQDPWKNQLLGS